MVSVYVLVDRVKNNLCDPIFQKYLILGVLPLQLMVCDVRSPEVGGPKLKAAGTTVWSTVLLHEPCGMFALVLMLATSQWKARPASSSPTPRRRRRSFVSRKPSFRRAPCNRLLLCLSLFPRSHTLRQTDTRERRIVGKC